jgi:predicted dehydrogenase
LRVDRPADSWIEDMDRIKTAVVGAGYLGRFHAQKYAAIPDSQLVAVVDLDAQSAARVAAECGTEALTDYRQLLGRVDAVSIVTPTPSHREIAAAFLESGTHVLVEKPMTATVAEADALIAAAARGRRVLQVGHLERFNAAILALDGILTVPRFIESNRLAPFRQRGTEVSVVLDLMIHDIDIIQNIVRSPIVSIDAIGSSVFSGELDIANARLRFASGCVANTTASRVSLKTERKLRLFQDDAYLSLDLHQKVMTLIRKGAGVGADGLPQVTIDERSFGDSDALKLEIESFLDAIKGGRPPVVSAEDGRRALATALQITEQVERSLRSGGH